MKAKWLIIIGALLCSLGLSGVVAAQGPSGQIEAVPLIGAWVDAGASETAPFSVTGTDGKTYEANFNDDILPLFTTAGLWYDKAQACSECHFAASKDSYHEMDLKTYKGILTGADSVSSPDNPEEIIIPGDWENSSLRARLRNNRMPPGMPFVLDESNRGGPCVEVADTGVTIVKDGGQTKYGCDLNAVALIGAWVDAKAPEKDNFTYGGASLNFERDVLPFFTTAGLWYDKAQACSECHFAASKDSYHEMDLKTYKGILTGADSVSSPDNPEEIIIPGDWENSSLRARLRNNRMPPGMPFVLDESNRNGPIVTIGQVGAPPELPKTGAERPAEWLNLGLVAAGLGLMSVGFFLRRLSRRA